MPISQEGFWLPLLALEASRTLHYCDMCEETFEKESDLIKHEEEHEVCGLEGCNFTASKEVGQFYSYLICF